MLIMLPAEIRVMIWQNVVGGNKLQLTVDPNHLDHVIQHSFGYSSPNGYYDFFSNSRVHLFEHPDLNHFSENTMWPDTDLSSFPREFDSALLHVCRTIRDEAYDVFFRHNVFLVWSINALHPPLSYCSLSHRFSSICHIRFHLQDVLCEPTFEHPKSDDWVVFWELLASMRLQSLGVSIRVADVKASWGRQKFPELKNQTMMEELGLDDVFWISPLLGIRGVKTAECVIEERHLVRVRGKRTEKFERCASLERVIQNQWTKTTPGL